MFSVLQSSFALCSLFIGFVLIVFHQLFTLLMPLKVSLIGYNAVCREYRPKHNVSFVENGTMVAAYTPKYFVFVREKSVGDPSVDLVTTVNIPAVVRTQSS